MDGSKDRMRDIPQQSKKIRTTCANIAARKSHMDEKGDQTVPVKGK